MVKAGRPGNWKWIALCAQVGALLPFVSTIVRGVDEGPNLAENPPSSSRTGIDGTVASPYYDGRSLAQWRRRMQSLRYDDPQIADELPGLLAIVEDSAAPWITRRQAALTLGRIGEPVAAAVPVLIKLLAEARTTRDEQTQLWLLKALALYGPIADDAAPIVAEFLHDEAQPDLPRLAAIETLGRIGPGHPAVMPAILNALSSPAATPAAENATQLDRRIAAAEILEIFGGHAAPAVPALIRALEDPSVPLRRAAATTLGAVGQSAGPAITVLAELVLFDESDEVRDLAGVALGKIGDEAEPALLHLLADPDRETARRAADGLAEFRELSPAARGALHVVSQHDDAAVRLSALRALWTAGRDESIIQRLVAELETDDRPARIAAVELLEALGPAALPAIPVLERLTTDPRPHVRQAARQALRNVRQALPVADREQRL